MNIKEGRTTLEENVIATQTPWFFSNTSRKQATVFTTPRPGHLHSMYSIVSFILGAILLRVLAPLLFQHFQIGTIHKASVGTLWIVG